MASEPDLHLLILPAPNAVPPVDGIVFYLQICYIFGYMRP